MLIRIPACNYNIVDIPFSIPQKDNFAMRILHSSCLIPPDIQLQSLFVYWMHNLKAVN